jgi:heptosyltransferase-2/heptosyltransferase-3
MANAFHSKPFKHQVRHALLSLVAHLPSFARGSRGGNRILLIRPDHLGDVLLTTPAIHALRQANPLAEIHALVGPWSADVVASYPEVDLVLTLPFPGFSRTPKVSWRSPYQLAFETARHLRRIGYGSAVILRPDHWWGALVAKLAAIPERIGYNLPDVAPFLTLAVDHQHEHVVMQSLRLVERWTGAADAEQAIYHFPVDRLNRVYVDGYLEEWGIHPDEPIISIHPGAGTWVKHWTEKNWALVADTLSEQLSAKVVFTGGDHELALVKRIVANMQTRPCVMVGDTRVSQLAALFSRARLVLGPDSGPLHLAAAVGTPTVSLFGPADPAEFGPWGSPFRHALLTSDIGCRPCRVLDWGGDKPEFHPCIRDIHYARVLEAARRVVNQE